MAEIVGFVGGFCLPPSTPGRTGTNSRRRSSTGWPLWVEDEKKGPNTHAQDESLPVSFSPFPSPPADEMFGSLSSSWWRFRWFGRRWFKVVRISRWRRVNDVVRAKTGICSSWRILLENPFGEWDDVIGEEGMIIEHLWNNLVLMEFSEDYIGDEEDWINFFWRGKIFWIFFGKLF